MGLLLLGLAGVLSVAVAALAVAGVGVPPEQGLLFGAVELVLTAIVAGLAYQSRCRTWQLPVARLRTLLLVAGGVAGASLLGYLLVYNFCVVEHPSWGRLLFPFWTSGRLAAMVERAGSRYGAVEMYGLAAVFDAISEMPGTAYAIALGTLLLLYAPTVAVACTMVLILALRCPSQLFRSGVTLAGHCEVFLCYNRADKLGVRAIARQLASRGIRFFLDESDNPPGQLWTDHIEPAIRTASSFAVFLGGAGIGRWQAVEIQNIAEARMERGCNVMPVFLPDAPESTKVPMLLAGLQWVDFRRADPDPMAALLHGIRTPPVARSTSLPAN